MPTCIRYNLELNRPFTRGQRCALCRRPVTVRRLAWYARQFSPRTGPGFYVCLRCKPHPQFET